MQQRLAFVQFCTSISGEQMQYCNTTNKGDGIERAIAQRKMWAMNDYGMPFLLAVRANNAKHGVYSCLLAL